MISMVIFRDVNMPRKKKRKKDSPTISELCHLNKAPIQSAAKAVCSSGLYIQALQQLKHLPKSLGQPPVPF